jgi:hypothetical protein
MRRWANVNDLKTHGAIVLWGAIHPKMKEVEYIEDFEI